MKVTVKSAVFLMASGGTESASIEIYEENITMNNDIQAVAAGVELTDGFHLLMDALEMNGITNMYGLLGIPVTEVGRIWQARGNKFFSFRNEQNAGYAASVAGYLTLPARTRSRSVSSCR